MPARKNSHSALLNSSSFLKSQIRSYEERIRSSKWSYDWHLQNVPGATPDDKYCQRIRDDIVRWEGWLVDWRARVTS
jgi:hypothetical protein